MSALEMESAQHIKCSLFDLNGSNTVTCSCCPYLYFGSTIMLVTYFVNFR